MSWPIQVFSSKNSAAVRADLSKVLLTYKIARKWDPYAFLPERKSRQFSEKRTACKIQPFVRITKLCTKFAHRECQRRLTRFPDTRLTLSCPPFETKNCFSFLSEALGESKFSSKPEWNWRGLKPEWHKDKSNPYTSQTFSPLQGFHLLSHLTLWKKGEQFPFLIGFFPFLRFFTD